MYQYLNEVITRYVDLPAETKIAVIAFLKADYIPVMYFDYDTSESGSSTTQGQTKDSKSFSKKLIHQMSHLSGRNSNSEDVAERHKKKPLVIQVSRNSSAGSLKFDVSDL